MTNYKKNMVISAMIFVVVQATIIGLLINRGDYGFVHNITAAACVWAVLTIIEIRYRLYLNNFIRLLVIGVIISDSFLGYYLNLYVTSFSYDRLQHVLGTYAFALFAYAVIIRKKDYHIPQLLAIILTIALGVSLGTVFEIIEFLADIALNPVVPNQSSLTDTNLDLLSDVAGAAIAGAHVGFGFLKDKLAR